MQALVLNAKKWKFKDETTDELREGGTIWFTSGVEIRDGYGVDIVKMSVPVNIVDTFHSAPGWFDLDVTVKQGKANKAELTVTGAKFIKGFVTTLDSDDDGIEV